MPREKFAVIIMHGHSDEYLKVRKLVASCGFKPVVLTERWSGELIFNKVRNNVWKKAHCAVVIMSPDDQTKDLSFRARQNVIFELGYCLGAFDSIKKKYWYHAVIILKESSVEKFADIDGLEYIGYNKKLTQRNLARLSAALERTFQKATEYYYELR
jgi:predicted nucleotide-binding protein